jgi:hypothetical protein
VLKKVDAQHALQANRRTAIACFGVVRLYHLAKGSPRHDCIHGPQEIFASGGFARMLESAVLICGHGQGLLLHLQITFEPPQWWTLISVALSDEDFNVQFEALNEELMKLNSQARELEQTIAANVAEILGA